MDLGTPRLKHSGTWRLRWSLKTTVCRESISEGFLLFGERAIHAPLQHQALLFLSGSGNLRIGGGPLDAALLPAMKRAT